MRVPIQPWWRKKHPAVPILVSIEAVLGRGKHEAVTVSRMARLLKSGTIRPMRPSAEKTVSIGTFINGRLPTAMSSAGFFKLKLVRHRPGTQENRNRAEIHDRDLDWLFRHLRFRRPQVAYVPGKAVPLFAI